MLSKRLAASKETGHRGTFEYKIFTYEGLIARAETEIDWALRGLKLVESLGSGTEPSSSDCQYRNFPHAALACPASQLPLNPQLPSAAVDLLSLRRTGLHGSAGPCR